MKLVPADHPALKTPCRKVENEELPELNKTKGELLSLMRIKKGLGLAAPQVGDSRCYFVWVHGIVINPSIIKTYDPFTFKNEGCLSYPGVRKDVRRFNRVVVAYTEYTGERVKKELKGLPAVVFQHECDHLNGKCSVAP